MFKLGKIAKYGSVLLVGSIIARFGSFAFKLIAIRSLTIEEYGEFALFLSLFLSFIPIATFSIAPSLSKIAANVRSEENLSFLKINALKLVFCSSVLAGIGFLVTSFFLGGYQDDYRYILLVIFAFLSAGYTNVVLGFDLAELKFGMAALYESSDSIIRLILIGIVAGLNLQLNSSLFVSVFCISLIMVAVYARCCSKLGIRHSFKKEFKRPAPNIALNIFGHSGYLMLVSFSTLMFAFLLRYYLSIYDHSKVGIFDLAMSLYAIPKLVFISIVRPLTPLTAKNGTREIYLPNIKKTFMIFIFIEVLIYATYQLGFAQYVFYFLGIEKYIEAFPIFTGLFLVALFDLMFGYLSSHLQGMGEVSHIFKIVLFSSCVCSTLAYFLINNFGLYGAVSSYILFYVIASTGIYLYCQKTCDVKISG